MSAGAMPTQPDNNSDETNNQQNATIQQNDNNADLLGLITTRPKESQYAIYDSRMNTFKEWPTAHHIKPDRLVEAGFFYTGVADAVRCFYCYGGLKNWKPEEDVDVEHARWFPKCGYLLQTNGRDFVDTVQALKKEQVEQNIPEGKVKITPDEVAQRMKDNNILMPISFKNRNIEHDAAVNAVADLGYDKEEICNLALSMCKSGESLSSDRLWELASEKGLSCKVTSSDNKENYIENPAQIEEENIAVKKKLLLEENRKLRQETTCKMCLDSEVDVVMLPCGHFVSCRECAMALANCPVCRKKIHGILVASLG